MPFSLNDNELSALDAEIKRKKPMQKNERLFLAGKKATSLYAVRSGLIKTFATNSEFDDIVCGFHIPGDVIGLDAMATGKHTLTAQALETSMLCEIPVNMLDELSEKFPTLKMQLLRLMSEEIGEMQQRLQFLNNKTAEQRLAAFIHTYAQRIARRGVSANKFSLTMTRADIGSFIDIRIETISRLLAKFSKLAVLEVTGKEFHILNMSKLAELGDCQEK